MGQSDILDILKKSKEPMSSRQIANALSINNTQVCFTLSRLLKYNEVSFIEINRLEAMKRFNYNVNRKLRLYYIDK